MQCQLMMATAILPRMRWNYCENNCIWFFIKTNTQALAHTACFVMMNLNSTTANNVHSFFDHFKHIYRYDMMSTIIYNCRILWDWRFSSILSIVTRWSNFNANHTVICTCELEKKLKEPSLSLSSSSLSYAVPGVWGSETFYGCRFSANRQVH